MTPSFKMVWPRATGSWNSVLSNRQAGRGADSYQKAIEIQQELVAENRSVVEYQASLAWSYHNLGLTLQTQGNLDEVLAFFHKVIAIYQELVSQNPEIGKYRSGLANSYNSLSALYWKNRDVDKAFAGCQMAIELEKKLVDENPTVAKYREWRRRRRLILGFLQRHRELDEGRFDSAPAGNQDSDRARGSESYGCQVSHRARLVL